MYYHDVSYIAKVGILYSIGFVLQFIVSSTEGLQQHVMQPGAGITYPKLCIRNGVNSYILMSCDSYKRLVQG